MKKVLLVLPLLVVLTGCGKDKVICVKDYTDLKETTTIIVKDNKIAEFTMEHVYKDKEISKENCEQIKTSLGSEFSVDCKDKKVIAKAKKLTGFNIKETSKEQVKKEMESEGYTCK